MSTRRGGHPAPLEFASVKDFLSLRQLPGRSSSWQAAALLGFEPQHIPVLVKARLLRTAGHAPPNAPKYFCTQYLLSLANDERWITRASDALVAHWATRNSQKKGQKP